MVFFLFTEISHEDNILQSPEQLSRELFNTIQLVGKKRKNCTVNCTTHLGKEYKCKQSCLVSSERCGLLIFIKIKCVIIKHQCNIRQHSLYSLVHDSSDELHCQLYNTLRQGIQVQAVMPCKFREMWFINFY